MQKSMINPNKDAISKQLFYRTKQWLYRGQRPGWIAKFFNRMWANAAAKKVMDNGLVALEVIGRKSGQVVSFPLVMVTVDGQRYLASMLGESQWVRNVRAAGGKVVLNSGGREDVQLEEIPAAQRAPLLKAYLHAAPGARPHVPVDMNAPLAEFEKVAAEYPVFHVVSNQKNNK
jgi:deazaflavin-dependent oxidoreductase (nitroreductase family)